MDAGVDKSSFNGIYGWFRHLQVTAEKGNTKFAQILLRNGADFNALRM